MRARPLNCQSFDILFPSFPLLTSSSHVIIRQSSIATMTIDNGNRTEWSSIRSVIMCSKPCETLRKKARVIDVKIKWVSSQPRSQVKVLGTRLGIQLQYRCPVTKSSNRIPVIGHPRDRAPITCQIAAQRTNHDREFFYRYD